LSYLTKRSRFVVAVKSGLKSRLALFSIEPPILAVGQRRPTFCSCLKGLLELIELTMHHLERSDLTHITQLENRFERWAVGISRIYPPIENRPVNACHLGKP